MMREYHVQFYEGLAGKFRWSTHLTGNIGHDPELRIDQSGNQFVTFSVAVAVGTKVNPKTDWVDVSCNGKLADIAYAYAKKGTKVLVDGFPATNAYINKDNLPISTLRLYANSIELLSYVDENSGGDAVYVLPDANSLPLTNSSDESF